IKQKSTPTSGTLNTFRLPTMCSTPFGITGILTLDQPLHTVQSGHSHANPQSPVRHLIALLRRMHRAALSHPPRLVFIENYLNLKGLPSPYHRKTGIEI